MKYLPYAEPIARALKFDSAQRPRLFQVAY